MASINDRIKEVATVENAKAYAETGEKYLFCVDLLDMYVSSAKTEAIVNALEDEFEILLAEGEQTE